MQVIFVILLHIDYTLNAKYEIFLKYLLFKRKISYFYYKKASKTDIHKFKTRSKSSDIKDGVPL